MYLFSNGKTKHTRIEYVDGKFSFMSSETESFPSVAELIEHWIQNTEKGILCYSKSARNAPTSYPVRLTKPISRYTEVQHYFNNCCPLYLFVCLNRNLYDS